MTVLFKRLLVYLLVPAGLVLLFFPLHLSRLDLQERDILYLALLEPTDATTATAFPKVMERDLARFPALAGHLDTMAIQSALWGVRDLPPRPLDQVPLKEWTAFTRLLDVGMPEGTFSYQDRFFRGTIASGVVETREEPPGLKTWCRMAGGVFLLLGILTWTVTYRHPGTGIAIGPRKTIVLWDVIVVAFGLVFTWWALDLFLARVFVVDTFWGEDPMLGMGVFWVAAAAPFMALFVTATAMQTLVIDSEGIRLKGLLGTKSLTWPDVQHIRLFEPYTPRKVAGVIAPHGTTKVLQVKGGETTLRIMEPPLGSTKQDIVDRLLSHAPQNLIGSIEECAGKWTSFW